MKDTYWTTTHDEAIKDYFYSVREEDRSHIIDKKLAKPLYELAKRCLTSFGLKPEIELEQDIVIHLVCKAMPKLTEDKLKGSLQYLWISARNYTLTYIIKPKKVERLKITPEYAKATHEYTVDCITYSYTRTMTTVDPVDVDAEYERIALHRKVLAEIDNKLNAQQVFNATNSVFLMLLKQYLIDNDYEVRGFGQYVMKAMNLKLSTYRAIAGRLGLRTKDFNEKK